VIIAGTRLLASTAAGRNGGERRDRENTAPFVAAVGDERSQASSAARAMAAAEVVVIDHAGAAIATVVFLSADDVGVMSVRERGTSALTASESAALRALLARHLP
jgi:hypothetical protein